MLPTLPGRVQACKAGSTTGRTFPCRWRFVFGIGLIFQGFLGIASDLMTGTAVCASLPNLIECCCGRTISISFGAAAEALEDGSQDAQKEDSNNNTARYNGSKYVDA